MIEVKYYYNELIAKIYSLEQNFSTAYIFLALTPLLLIISMPFNWTGNEENYFQLAFSRVSPDSFSPYDAVFDESDGRFFFETLLGYLIFLVGYDTAHSIARLLNIVALSAGLSVFFNSIRMSLLSSLVTMIAFIYFGQQFFGGEWIFGGVEAKTFAYACIFISLGLMFKNKLRASIFFIVLATYLHFLVGGFWAILIIIYAGFSKNNLGNSFKVFLAYSLMIMPVVVLLAFDQFSGQVVIEGVNVGKIYVDRNTHHIAPFHSLGSFYWGWLNGIILLACFSFLLLLIKFSNFRNHLVDISLILTGYLFAALILAFLDKNTMFLSKFYIFRPSSLILLLCIVSVCLFLQTLSSKKNLNFLSIISFPFILYFIAVESKPVLASFLGNNQHKSQTEIIKAVHDRALPSDIVLLDTKNFEGNAIALHRKLQNPTLVSYKFVPTNPTDILEWHSRLSFKDLVLTDGCNIIDWKYPVRFVVTFTSESENTLKPCGKVVWENADGSALIQLR